MKSAHLTKLTVLLLLLLPELGCSFATFRDPGPSNFASTTPGLNNSLEQTRPRGLYATTKDGRTVLLKEGTWEFASNPLVTNTTATLPNGQVVLLRGDGTWIYQGPNPDRPREWPSPRRTLAPAPASFLHIYQLDGGSGKAPVFLDRARIANLRERRYFVVKVRPGLHTISVFSLSKDPFAFTTVNGMHYYLKNSDTFGLWKEKFQLVSAATGKSEIETLRLLDGTDILSARPDLFVQPQMVSRN